MQESAPSTPDNRYNSSSTPESSRHGGRFDPNQYHAYKTSVDTSYTGSRNLTAVHSDTASYSGPLPPPAMSSWVSMAQSNPQSYSGQGNLSGFSQVHVGPTNPLPTGTSVPGNGHNAYQPRASGSTANVQTSFQSQPGMYRTPAGYNSDSPFESASQFYSQPPGHSMSYFPTQQYESPSSWGQGNNMVGINEALLPGQFQVGPANGSGSLLNKSSAVSEKYSKILFSLRNRFRAKKPNAFQLPGYEYNTTLKFRHRDAAGRVSNKPLQDRYLHPLDGRLRKLIVASTDDIYEAPGTSTWRRTYIRNVYPWNVRISTWVIDFHHDPDSWKAWFFILGRAFVANIALQIAFYIKSYQFFTEETARWVFEGKYAPVPIEFNGNAKIWSNHLENRDESTLASRETEAYQVLKPRDLCFLRMPEERDLHGVEIRSVREWEETDGREVNLSYVFVAYFTEHFHSNNVDDMVALSTIAERAARNAGVVAYWVAASNMRDDNQLESDVFRISDVLRGAQSMAIAVGRPSTAMHEMSTDELLRQWGTRVWTFPEVLLSPGREISVYTRGDNLSAPLILSKNQFAGRVWSDAQRSRQLVDHYLGNLTLSKLELAVTALRCLYDRKTTQYLPGDQAYALVGLLRMRPKIDRNDTSFQAFARLSLANDSDEVLERYLCTLPDLNKEWYEMTDVYKSALWDIVPYCQVAGVCGISKTQGTADSDTIILDGAFGASIQWKAFYPVKYQTGFSWKRWVSLQIMENNGMLLTAAMFAWAIAKNWQESGQILFDEIINQLAADTLPWWLTHITALCRTVAGIFFTLYIWSWLYTPALIKMEYAGKFRGVDAALFGFEGYLNIATIERCIFGGNFKRMKWSINGSPLSRSYTDEDGDRYGTDPTDVDPVVRQTVEKAKKAGPDEMRIFTLVDTYNMEVTLFESVRPPTNLFLCASEGGMQRAIGCSYDWTTQTMHRETVLRMPTTSLNKMDRVPRFKIGVRRPPMSFGVIKSSTESV
ncbi:uncharacterized protein BCR38DRAFT_411492 [Pseudomassariella vexata]|uniref:Uncharacterized protein n=1 Tax=Pseudomassariella vexata TaxID=1141098 RepID=A0A1Y2DQT0_9PEZI|nr:uncharacterized protein BCR38DRAFT_411492 [Pseudomassariella vexata]ORY61638.1 hypothetical protein BCR38DRAFT_411492 [Pseudomassariella vexata]